MTAAAIGKITGLQSAAELVEYIDIATDKAVAEVTAITAAAFPHGFGDIPRLTRLSYLAGRFTRL